MSHDFIIDEKITASVFEELHTELEAIEKKHKLSAGGKIKVLQLVNEIGIQGDKPVIIMIYNNNYS